MYLAAVSACSPICNHTTVSPCFSWPWQAEYFLIWVDLVFSQGYLEVLRLYLEQHTRDAVPCSGHLIRRVKWKYVLLSVIPVLLVEVLSAMLLLHKITKLISWGRLFETAQNLLVKLCLLFSEFMLVTLACKNYFSGVCLVMTYSLIPSILESFYR